MDLTKAKEQMKTCSLRAHSTGIHPLEDECEILKEHIDQGKSEGLEDIEYLAGEEPEKWFEKRLMFYKDL